jgi:hypothetical protein
MWSMFDRSFTGDSIESNISGVPHLFAIRPSERVVMLRVGGASASLH